MSAEAVRKVAGSTSTRRAWPYRVASIIFLLGVLGLLTAPFGGAVYIALPGIALGTWFAFIDRSPFRIVFLASLSAFLIGLAVGAAALYLGASSDFLSQESGFVIGAAALWAVPILGIVLGAIALVGARFRPGVPDSALHLDDFESV